MKDTDIEWADHTHNEWSGCDKVSPGCKNCYAESLSKRFPTLGNWGPGAPRKLTSEANLRKPLRWNEEARIVRLEAERTGKPYRRPRVFSLSLGDFLDPEVPAEWLAGLLNTVAKTPELDWLLLTKRPELWRERMDEVIRATHELDDDCGAGGCPTPHVWKWLSGIAPSNVWVGTSVEDQARADERIPHLLQIPARVRFLSCEPLLGPVDLENVSPTEPGTAFRPLTGPDGPSVHWVIAGGESGPGARPMHPQWVRSLRDQCQAAGVPFLFKQWGAWAPGLVIRDDDKRESVCLGGFPHPITMVRAGKKAAGRELDGRTWDQVPSS